MGEKSDRDKAIDAYINEMLKEEGRIALQAQDNGGGGSVNDIDNSPAGPN